MRCDVFQTLLYKKKGDLGIDVALTLQPSMDVLAEFTKIFGGAACKSFIENEGMIKSGIAVDGKPLDPRTAGPGLSMLRSMLEVCKAPTQESARHFFRSMTQQDGRSCKIHNDHSQISFGWNAQTNSWISREGPTGPCGAFVLGTLTQDAKTSFWSYVEKTLRTNPKGNIPDGQSCGLYPERTLNYSWHTANTSEGCDFIESEPD